jgi:hypothetical protein
MIVFLAAIYIVSIFPSVWCDFVIQEPHPQPPPRLRGGGYDVAYVIRKCYILKTVSNFNFTF